MITRIPITFSRRGILVAGSASVVLAGCGGSLISPSLPPLQIYVLKPRFQLLADIPPVTWQLSIAQPEAPQSFQHARIALERGDTMDYYADAQWTDPTPHLLQSLLVQAFEICGRITGVAPESAGMHADYLLETEVRDFEAHYGSGDVAPNIVVSIGARLLSVRRGDVVGTFESRHETGATQNSVPAVAEAFAQATGETVEEIVRWTLQAPHKIGSSAAREPP